LSRIIERVEQGEEIVISRAGHPVAQVVPLPGRVRRHGRRSLRGQLELAPDWDSDDAELPDEIKDRLDREQDVRVSAATIWEIALKQALGKITAPAALPERVRDCGFRELPVDFTHTMAAGRLPPIHRDPFDRMLVAQARCEGLTLVTRDSRCQQYEVAVLPF